MHFGRLGLSEFCLGQGQHANEEFFVFKFFSGQTIQILRLELLH